MQRFLIGNPLVGKDADIAIALDLADFVKRRCQIDVATFGLELLQKVLPEGMGSDDER